VALKNGVFDANKKLYGAVFFPRCCALVMSKFLQVLTQGLLSADGTSSYRNS
jgi:hypothetical protein